MKPVRFSLKYWLLILVFVVFVLAKPAFADPATWAQTGLLNQPRQYHTATLLTNGKVLVAGGLSFSAPSGERASAELYDPATGYWQTTGTMNQARYYHTATLLGNGKVLVVGGLGVSGVLASAELYDPTTGMWTITGSLNQARQYHTATLLANGQVLVVGGYVPGFFDVYLTSAELYDPITGTWTMTGTLNESRGEHTATLLNNGQVLVVGGYAGPSGLRASTELYDPNSGLWTMTGSLSGPARRQHTTTLLPNGNVLVAGGSGSGFINGNLSIAELYNPASGLWTATSALNGGRRLHTATLLLNGQVLVAGGYSAGGVLATSELYDPATGLWTTTGSMASPGRIFYTATRLINGDVLAVAGSNDSATLASAELYKVPDTIAPETTINSQPPDPDSDSTPTFTFSGDDGAGSGIASFMCQIDNGIYNACTSPFTSIALLDGTHTFNVYAIDVASNIDLTPASYTWALNTVPAVIFNWTGFFQPVDNLPMLNLVNAGRAIPIKFSLGGNQGLNIFSAGYPKSELIACNSNSLVDGIEVTSSAGSSSLSYDPVIDQYSFVWKTEKSWAGTCRQWVLKLTDGSTHRANFKLK